MNIKPIRNNDDLQAAFKRLEVVYQAQDGTPEADEMEILVMLIEAYEHKRSDSEWSNRDSPKKILSHLSVRAVESPRF